MHKLLISSLKLVIRAIHESVLNLLEGLLLLLSQDKSCYFMFESKEIKTDLNINFTVVLSNK